MPSIQEAHTMFIQAKCSDLFNAEIFDKTGDTIFEYSGYVPEFFPDQHYGDYVMLEIELATGKILNWRKPSQAALKKMQANSD